MKLLLFKNFIEFVNIKTSCAYYEGFTIAGCFNDPAHVARATKNSVKVCNSSMSNKGILKSLLIHQHLGDGSFICALKKAAPPPTNHPPAPIPKCQLTAIWEDFQHYNFVWFYFCVFYRNCPQFSTGDFYKNGYSCHTQKPYVDVLSVFRWAVCLSHCSKAISPACAFFFTFCRQPS